MLPSLLPRNPRHERSKDADVGQRAHDVLGSFTEARAHGARCEEGAGSPWRNTTMTRAALVLSSVLAACGSVATAPTPQPAPSASGQPAPPAPPATPEEIAAHVAALEHARGSAYAALDQGDALALVTIGEPAVPASIDCFENDTRLTELSDDEWMLPGGHLDVSTLCLRVVERILDESGLAYREGAQDRHQAAAALRRYVDRYLGMTPLARRLAMLDDPTTSDQVAGIAARWLTTGTGELDRPSAIDYVGTRRRLGPPRAASLRADAGVDLTGTLVARAIRAMDSGRGHEACEISAAAIEWDASAEPRLLPVGRACLAAVCPCSYAFVALVAHADPTAAVAFLEGHGTTLLASDPFSRARGVEMAAALDVPEVRAVVEARLAATDLEAALHEAVRQPPPHGLAVLLLAWARAGLPAARTALDRALSDGVVLGSIVPDPGADGSRVELASAQYSLHLPEPLGASQSVRASDLVASTLASELDEPFSLGWPIERRDAAIVALRARVAP